MNRVKNTKRFYYSLYIQGISINTLKLNGKLAIEQIIEKCLICVNFL